MNNVNCRTGPLPSPTILTALNVHHILCLIPLTVNDRAVFGPFFRRAEIDAGHHRLFRLFDLAFEGTHHRIHPNRN